MGLENNIKTNRTIVEYRYKYKHRRKVLKRISAKEVNDFDKANAVSVYKGDELISEEKHLLLKGRKWWLIDGTYYQVPKPFTLCWFRNWSKGAKITGYSILGLALALSVGGHFFAKEMLKPCADIALDVDVGDHASIQNLHFDADKNLICNIIPKTSFVIDHVAVKKGEVSLVENKQFTYTYDYGQTLKIFNFAMEIPGKIIVSPVFGPLPS